MSLRNGDPEKIILKDPSYESLITYLLRMLSLRAITGTEKRRFRGNRALL